MTAIPARITGWTRVWLESQPPTPHPDPPRIVRTCQDCATWVFGADCVEAADRLADHRGRCHD